MESTSYLLIIILSIITLLVLMVSVAGAVLMSWKIFDVLNTLEHMISIRNEADALSALSRGDVASARLLANGNQARLFRLNSLQHQISEEQANINALEEQISSYASLSEVPVQIHLDLDRHRAHLNKLIKEVQSV